MPKTLFQSTEPVARAVPVCVVCSGVLVAKAESYRCTEPLCSAWWLPVNA